MIEVIHDKQTNTLHALEPPRDFMCDWSEGKEETFTEVWKYAFDGKKVCSTCFPGHRLNTSPEHFSGAMEHFSGAVKDLLLLLTLRAMR